MINTIGPYEFRFSHALLSCYAEMNERNHIVLVEPKAEKSIRGGPPRINESVFPIN